MFERFTDRARRIVILSQEEARVLGHNYIGTEHILLGLLREDDDMAGEVLTSMGVSLDAAREEVTKLTGRGREDQAAAVHIPFTPRAKKVLELSLRESLQLGHSYIGSEHILLGLIREGEGAGAQVLVRLGADLNRAREQLLLIARSRPLAEVPSAGGLAEPPLARSQPRAREIASRLASIDQRLTSIEDRLAAIERGLGTQRPGGGEPAETRTPRGAGDPDDTNEPPGDSGPPGSGPPGTAEPPGGEQPRS